MISATHGGGFQTYNKNILKQLFINSDDNEYCIYTNDKSLHSTNDKINLIFISNFYSKTIPRLLWMQIILPIHIFLTKIDILFSPMNILPIILKLSKIKKILVIHSNLPWLFPNDVPGSRFKLIMQTILTNISIRVADRIVVDSITAKNEISRIFRNINNKITTIYLGVDSDVYFENPDIGDYENFDIVNEPYFLTISSAVRYHCLKELIVAYEKLCECRNNIPKYLIISKNLDSKYYNEISEMIDASSYSEKIILLEDIDSEKISLLYKNASLYIFSSYCEVFGLTNLEAMQYGIPVLTSNKSALPEICGSAAIYFDPHDPNDIKNKIIELYSNNNLKQKMITNGYRQIKKYSWEKTFEKTLKLINNC